MGTDSASAAERGNNLYETPLEATRTLLALESFSNIVKEPACGKGAMSKLMEDAGYEVEIADLVDYGTTTQFGEVQRVSDFLTAEPWLVGADIATNPPYGQALNAFVAHALRVHRPRKMALLLNLNFLCGFDDPDRNYAMDECKPARVHVFTRRLPMMHRDGWDGNEATSRMNTAWFIWEQNEAGLYAGPTVLNRIDWKDFQ
ncbi:class I SAM-dependent methyltransferase [Mesorhizobium sp. M4A.F.Ca.ET.090.04.2.1]|nr:class I SAM-dependent methyltransferase [Mesorhizobium sp. M4A.F.Ca.ET.090.04.2.1]